ncbi:MAG TPA: YoaK family protein [Nocardioides sp.]|uniref:YoaK family protein n=1 Tax=Nocardioides sp. TaxID=35761 RepID=UPI002E337E87|nr:YoaK family protein [Nocardioides sp.]HEX3930114.1 YoaK family protein [Nocardioides sp.]
MSLAVAEGREDLVNAPVAGSAATPSRQSPDTSPRPGAESVGQRTRSDRVQGPLPVLLILLTIVTGLVDAFSYLSLGRVFVANMTGNVVFVGFGLAGAGGISVAASLLAVLAFTLGAAAGGRWSLRHPPHRGHLLRVAATTQTVLVVTAAVVAGGAGISGQTTRFVLIGLLAGAMGGQNAVARRLGVPDLTTTVLTLTVTGLVADATSVKVRFRRLLPVLAMLGGALVGGALLRWLGPSAPLWIAAALLASVAVGAHVAIRRPTSEAWG